MESHPQSRTPPQIDPTGEHLVIDMVRMRKAHVTMLCEWLEPAVKTAPSAGDDPPLR